MTINTLNSCQTSSFDNFNWGFDSDDERLIQENPVSKELVQTVMKYGKNKYHKSALYNAVMHRDHHACQVLVSAGAHVSLDVEKALEKVNCPSLEKIILHTHYNPSLEKYSFTVRKKDYMFQTYFELDSKEMPPYELIKHKISIATSYSMQSENGYEGFARARIVSLGALYAWARDLDLYDKNGDYFGMIDGEMLTTAEAKFSFFDKDGNKLAIAYLDEDKTGFTIVHAEKSARVIARMQRNFVIDSPDAWEVKVYHGQDLDSRFIKCFAAFAVDSQGLFKKDV